MLSLSLCWNSMNFNKASHL
uniref:Uncharacterized protein n=1 Tax=Rhizophora mucronata TaxID=61149 RepID=A0A2P2K641_RHIMU